MIHFIHLQSSINDRDLEKPQRRLPKGAAAQMAAQKRRTEEQLARARETEKKIKLEEITNEEFKKIMGDRIDNNYFCLRLKHHILGLDNGNFKL